MELKVVERSATAESRLTSAQSVEVQDKVRDHPCFSKDAHHHYARMHVAVAPACNIQCHYCNRKYDCANESRPGVVSELLTPELAVKKVLAVAAEIPQLSVLGIAGPGDPLANPERTFATFAELSEKAPDIRLCVSTNGLMLPAHVDQLCEHNIDHVTITINCIDPEIGARIYPWIFWHNRRIRGKKAAAILIEQQLKGLEMLAERGVLVKINSVLIPGVNDQHLAEVSRVVKQKGAFLHNIMPLIAEPEHGTFYGLMGQRTPTSQELNAVQQACANDMDIMSHCRQCRADAIGMLGQDRHAEFTLERIESLEIDHAAAMERRAQVRAEIERQRAAKRSRPQPPVLVSLDALTGAKPVPKSRPNDKHAAAPAVSLTKPGFKVAVASHDGQQVDQAFAEAQTFAIYQLDVAHAPRLLETRTVPAAGADLSAALAGVKDCGAVLCTRIGFDAWQQLEAAGIRPLSVQPGTSMRAALAQAQAETAAAITANLDALAPALSA
ncbi:nitrogenase cofactor biosynthesis protein NifB [Rhabdochromatium marinum]|uniref:nitrogenase cofactor biosynthesis protein NifB n=1 Tax=Rhabdochromatium marinum TaxID=48729 RepID=UPI001904BB07|nr:nitrogenase cofactor biosynthesis protein NifB [Rhabdochromatium marinum]MBK1649130.1 nitrogenase cofactor biosynthesis protein NifB [Rhabdochromatium marinum]